jgi:Glyoxalase-like domain
VTNRVDHFTIGTASLEEGVAALRGVLGVDIPRGSKHTAMSTHNCVTQAGNESFLELLAIDPDAPDPGRARWFSMDDPAARRRISERPRALCWVVNTDDLDRVVATSPVDLGEIVHFSRGERTWRLTVPKDGHLPENGLVPAFIEWSPGPHPSSAQQDLGVRLDRVRLTHPEPETLRSKLKALGVDHLASISEGAAGLAFELRCPKGLVIVD